MSLLEITEICAVVFNLIYLFLLIRENIWCWLNGIVASLLSIYLFFEAKLYSECILYGFYVLVGIYGWLVWAGKISKKEGRHIVRKGVLYHLMSILAGAVGTDIMGWWFSAKTDAKQPWFDAFSTSYSFVASFLEAHKVLSAWLYWIILNLFSVWLYKSRNLEMYAALMVVYFLASMWGYFEWRKRYFAAL